MKTILIHGFNVHKPENTVGKLKAYLPRSEMFAYGWRFFSVLWHNKKDATKLKARITNTKCDVWGHSNGCAIAVEAARQGAKIRTLVLINPALRVDTVFPDTIDKVVCVYTNNDKATKQAKFWGKVPFINWLVPNSWGAGGAYGCDNADVKLDYTMYLSDHSDFFTKENLDMLMPVVVGHTK